MKISVERLFHPDIASIEIDSPVRFEGDLAERYPAGVRVAGQITRIAHGVHLRGQVQGDERETCVRCLEVFWRRADVAFDETFSEDVAPADELFSDVAPLVGRSIDLTQLVEQVLEVDEPLAAVCTEHCRGICAHCGANRNQTDCTCHEGVIDERLAGLAALRDELTREERTHRRC